MKKSNLLGAVCALFLCFSAATNASVIITAQQLPGGVVFGVSGSLDLSGLTLVTSGNGAGVVIPQTGVIYVGASMSLFDQYIGLTGPASFGSGGFSGFADSSSGGLIGVSGSENVLRVPAGYMSFADLSATMILNGKTLAGLGITPSTYTWEWTTAASTTEYVQFRVAAVPVPAAAWLFASGLLGLVGMARRKKA